MKNRKFNILLIIAGVLLGLSSCNDFLTEEPKSNLTPEQVFTDLKVLEPTVDGLYSSYRGAKAGRGGWALFLTGLDEAKQGIIQMGDQNLQSALDNYDGTLSGETSQIAEMWGKRWPIINSAARCIRGLELMIETETDEGALAHLTLLKANACFVRALCMFEMAMLWGEVPVIDIQDLNNAEVDMSKQSLPVVWQQIFDDFTFAAQNLDKGKQTGSRATQGAAIAMLGKLYLYAPEESTFRDYTKAIGYFEQIINNYSLTPSYATIFDELTPPEFNLPESIFEIDFRCNDSGRSGWQWDMGSRTMASLSFGEGCYLGGYDVVLPTEYAYKMRSEGGVWEEGDLRRTVNVRYEYTYQRVTYTEVSWGADELDPHIKKWEDRRVDGFTPADLAAEAINGRSFYRSGKNYLMLRYADIMLCYAECLNEVGRTSEAINLVNKVRERAWGGTLPADKAWNGVSQAQFRIDILDERMRELCFEGWRRMDLIRTQQFKKLISERNPWAKEKGTIQDYHMRYPIPNVEIRNNVYMTNEDQNPGYVQ